MSTDWSTVDRVWYRIPEASRRSYPENFPPEGWGLNMHGPKAPSDTVLAVMPDGWGAAYWIRKDWCHAGHPPTPTRDAPTTPAGPCRWCRGTGRVFLIFSHVDCECRG